MEHFFKAYVCLGHISQSFTQNYQHNLSIDEIYNLQYLEIVLCDLERSAKVLLKVIDANWELNLETVFLICQVKCLRTKMVILEQFSSN